MRVLNTTTYKLENINTAPTRAERLDPAHAKANVEKVPDTEYAILSHRWIPSESQSEVTFGILSEWLKSAQEHYPFAGHEHDEKFRRSIKKIKIACSKAREEKIEWLWIDTCCINKSSDAEAAESIRSMYSWYRNAKICYAYLYDVDSTVAGTRKFQASEILRMGEDKKSDSDDSIWFRRGWTLQELLAPKEVRFYDFKWREIGTKAELAKDIAAVSGIDAAYLGHDRAFRKASIATKMSWLANRTTTRCEDIAYSTLGIFGISDFSPLYGEGMNAFLRLQKALVPRQDESLYAWTMPVSEQCLCPGWAINEWGLLAPWPACFKDSAHIHVGGKISERASGGFNLLGPGVNVRVPLKEMGQFMPWRKNRAITLNCWTSNNKAVRIPIKRASRNSLLWRRQKCHKLKLSRKSAPPRTNLNQDPLSRGRITTAGVVSVSVFFVQPSVDDDSDDDKEIWERDQNVAASSSWTKSARKWLKIRS
ncbi:hypothetical protein LTS15_009360 [Exophiala xenobiotica]|nr:hypothetical protein LTS15_009360 [Exophiala xenobiotica]